MSANGISTLTIPTGITATSYTQASSYLVAVGTFNYDAYGNGFAIRKDSGTVDAYINQVLALGPGVQHVYTGLAFSYGSAKISFTLNADGTFSNVTVADGAGGYPYGPGVDPVIIMPGDQLTGGTTPANDIYWEYVAPAGAITGFTYRSGNPSGSKDWTFVPANGQPSFTRLMRTPMTSVELPAETVPTWNITTHDAVSLGGTGVGQLNTSLIPNGTAFVIYATELGGSGGADKEARQIAKLNIAQAKRQGKTVAVDGTISGSVDTTKPYYRAKNTYNLTLLPDTYATNADDNANTSGLLQGRPWYDPNTEAFYDGEVLEVSPGIWRTNYQNYYFEDGNFFDTAVLKTGDAAYNDPTSDISIPDLPEFTSIMLKGYMKVTYTGTYTFYLDCDDGAYMWFGDNAITNWKDTEGILINYDINNGGEHGQQEVTGTVNLTAGNYIPLRVAFGNNGGPGVLIVSYSHTGQSKTSDFTGKIFYRTTTNGF